jgi:transcriptional regulator with XRE-family HTH domain
MSENSELYFFIGLRIKQARTDTFGHRLMTQSELAKAAGCTFQQIQKYEKATNKISIEKLDKIAQYTKKPLAYFLPHTVVDSTTISG